MSFTLIWKDTKTTYLWGLKQEKSSKLGTDSISLTTIADSPGSEMDRCWFHDIFAGQAPKLGSESW